MVLNRYHQMGPAQSQMDRCEVQHGDSNLGCLGARLVPSHLRRRGDSMMGGFLAQRNSCDHVILSMFSGPCDSAGVTDISTYI